MQESLAAQSFLYIYSQQRIAAKRAASASLSATSLPSKSRKRSGHEERRKAELREAVGNPDALFARLTLLDGGFKIVIRQNPHVRVRRIVGDRGEV